MANEYATQRRLRIRFITPCVDEGFFDPVKRGMRDAADMLNVECTMVGTDDVDLAAQAGLIREAMEEGLDGLAVSIIHPTALNEVLLEAIRRGTRVVAFNVDASDRLNGQLTAVCQDTYASGRMLGEKARPAIPDGSRVLLTMHSQGISALEDRRRGIEETLQGKDLVWCYTTTGIDPESAAQVVGAELERDTELRAVLCTGQADLEGAALTVARGSAHRDLYVAGFDLSARILDLIQQDVIAFTIDQQPYVQGFYPVVQLAQWCRFGLKPCDIDAGAGIIDKGNVADVLSLSQQGYR